MIEIKEGNLREVLAVLANEYGAKIEKFVLNPATGEVRQGILITLNNRDIRGLHGIETQVKEGDKITFLPPIAGG